MLRVSLLGEQVITDDATGIVRTRSSRAVVLVAYLVLHAGAPQSRQHLAGLFWPDSTDAQALTNLRRELHHLRQILPAEPSLLVTPRDLCWRDSPSCRVDLRTFEVQRAVAVAGDTATVLTAAAAALAEYRGELLPGAYDDWLPAPRARIERECIELCDRLGRAQVQTGDLAGAVATARRRIELAPLEEVGYRTLMEIQAELGDRAGAVSTYHHCASVLERELGIEPDEATRQALRRLAVRPAAAEPDRPVGRSEPHRPTGRSGAAAAQLVGRSAELGLLRDRWRAATAGHAELVLVRGDPGVGKTRLVAELTELARSEGAVVAGTECFGTSGQLALAPVADWLRAPAIRAATATLDPVWRDEVDRLVPSTPDRGEPALPARAMVDAWQRHRFLEGLARALIGLGRPMLLVLDNLQWCDQETLAFLPFYLGLAAGAPVLVAATVRADAPELGDWTARMRAGGRLTELAVSPLEAADTGRLAAAISGFPLAADDTALLYATTGGFPLYVVEAARTTADLDRAPLPVDDLTAVLRNRLDQVSPAAREVAALAAAVGRDFTLELLAEASDLTADTVVEAIDELWRRRIVREVREGYDFSHDLLRDTAYGQVSPPRRWLLHRRLAQGLELLHASDTDAVSAQLAEQYARGGRPERAVAYYRRAADIAAARFAHAEAIRLHRDALAILRTLPAGAGRDGTELDILEAMAAPLNARYGYASVELQRTMEHSVELADGLGRAASAFTARVGLWSTQFVQGNLDDGHRTVTRALALAEPDSERAGVAHFAFGGSSLSLGRPAVGLRHFEIAATLAHRTPSLTVGTRPDVHGSAWAAHAHWLLGHDDEARSTRAGAIALARDIGHPYSLAVALAYGGITSQLCDDRAELTETVAELTELCGRYGFAYYREWALILGGWCRQDGSGTEPARQGIAALRASGSMARMPYWLALLADLHVRAGRPDAAIPALDAALADGYARHDLWWLPEVLRLRAAHDDRDAAIARLDGAARMATEHGSVALLRRCERDRATRAASAAGAFRTVPAGPNDVGTPAS
ncbi:MAG TPA: AAA family ATPase [Mycobacteriales bacterium]|nr:AAA family ATPase [Mycobacteriales bacterium]